MCNTEVYRSGHNEAVLKTVCPQGHGGSNPSASAIVKKKTHKAVSFFCDYRKNEGFERAKMLTVRAVSG